MKNTMIQYSKILFIGLLISAVAISCSSENRNTQESDSTEMVSSDSAKTGGVTESADNCYTYIKNRDTASLKLHVQDHEITGDLSYKLFEKDSNKGTIVGALKGDTIIAEYTFDSEGMRSIREVIFLKKDGKLYEGYGDTEEKGVKVIFKNRSALKFDSGIVFDKTDCK
ncbi:hypothetical protein ACVWYN_002600 [Pedobacter sp. UYP24]